MAITDWELLRVLLATARAGSFRRAAAVLGLTQPTIGKKIDRLEQEAGARLMIRTKAGISLTPSGKALCQIAEEMERLTARALDYQTGGVRGRVTVATSDAMGAYWLPTHLQQFHRENQNITIDIKVLNIGEEIDLSKREADIAVTYRFPTDMDVVVLRESILELVPICTSKFADEWGIPSSMADMRRFPVVAQSFHYHKFGGLRPWAEMLEDHPMVRYRTESSLISGLVTKSGIGISLQPIGVIDREPDVIVLDLDGYRCHMPYYLVSHKAVKDVPAVRAVVNCLLKSLFFDDGAGSPAKRVVDIREKPEPFYS